MGTFIYYALMFDATMLVSLSNLVATQSKATEKNYNDIVCLLDYNASHPTAVVRYK